MVARAVGPNPRPAADASSAASGACACDGDQHGQDSVEPPVPVDGADPRRRASGELVMPAHSAAPGSRGGRQLFPRFPGLAPPRRSWAARAGISAPLRPGRRRRPGRAPTPGPGTRPGAGSPRPAGAGRDDAGDSGLPGGQGPGLVQQQCRALGEAFEYAAVLHDHSAVRRRGKARDQCHWRRQHERAERSHDQNRDSSRRATQLPGRPGHGEGQRQKPQRVPVGEPDKRRLRLLGF